jgi:hypothetical protein
MVLAAGVSSSWAAAQDGGSLPSLDEMLGLVDEAAPPATDPFDAALDRMLTATEAAEQFEQAIQLMDDTVERLSQPGGTDLVTQRLQEDILRKLDAIIASGEQNQQQGSGGSSSPSSGQQPSSANRPTPQTGGAQASSGRGENTGQTTPPGAEDPSLRSQTLMDAAAWGALPDRLRDALQQGLNEPFSAAYRRLTEAYYRRLAEQAEGDE